MSGSPMDPKRLAHVREQVELGVLDDHVQDLAQVLADRDHLVTRLARCAMELGLERGKAQRYRSRCPVTAEDVEAAGVTREKCEAWLTADGWRLGSHPTNPVRTWQKKGVKENASLMPSTATWPNCLASCIAVTITLRARDTRRPAFDILDEMAKEPAR